MVRIGLVGLPYDDNLGDPLMIECVRELCIKELSNIYNFREIEFEVIDLMAREDKENIPLNQNIRYFGSKILKKLSRDEHAFQRYEIMSFNYGKKKLFRNYYEAKISKVDFVIIVGGALITYRYNRNFHSPMAELISVAESLNKKVIINSVGIENGFDLSYESCKMVKKYLNSRCVVGISTRDDFETLVKYLDFPNDKIIELAADSAVFSNEIFKDIVKEKNYTLGLGIISPDKFNQYSESNLKSKYISIMRGILLRCVKEEINFCLFTNGHSKDYEFAKELIHEFNLSNEKLLPKAANHRELVCQISQFDKIIASRLHSCILAFSMNIPFVGIDWNGKIKFFSKIISRADFVVSPNEINNPELVFKKLNDFSESYYLLPSVKEYKESENRYLAKSFRRILEMAESAK